MSRRIAFTLMEMVVYMGMFALAGLVIATIFSVSRRTQQSTASAYAVTGQADTTMQWLRQDFQETALGTIRSYSGTADLKPAVSMISARGAGDSSSPGKLFLSEYGTPHWDKNVFYAVHHSTGAQTGDLIRWEVPLTGAEQDRLPRVASMPTSFAQVAKPRVLLHNVLSPQQTVTQLGGLNNGWPKSDWGGFRVQFVRRTGGEDGNETLSDVNPALNLNNVADNTRLVEIELTISESTMGPPNFYDVKFRCFPRY